MICNNCGAKIGEGESFCCKCGTPVGAWQNTSQNNMYNAGNNRKPDRKISPAVVISIVVACVALLLAAVAVGFLIYSNGSESNTTEQVTEVITETPAQTQSVSVPPVNEPHRGPAAESEIYGTSSGSERTSTYNSSLTYKRMSGIHSSTPTNDSVFHEIKAVIEDFNMQCEAYMNGITYAVPEYLRPGTTAYNQQVEYKHNHPTLTQKYRNIDVTDTRYGTDGYYYAWVGESIEKNEKGVTKVSTDHWVYKLECYGGYWYILDYTADPAHK